MAQCIYIAEKSQIVIVIKFITITVGDGVFRP